MRMIIAVDPRHYERRYRKALRDRWVIGYLDEDGVAIVKARGLCPAQAAAALERVDALARAARSAGHPSTLDQIRVDVVAGLLDGTLHNLDRAGLIAHLIAHRSANDDPPGDDQQSASSDAAAASDDTGATTSATSADADTSDPGTTADDAADPNSGNAAGANPCKPGTGDAGRTDADPCKPGTSDAGRTDADPGEPGTGKAGGADATATGGTDRAGKPNGERTGVEIRIALSALLGRTEHPGEVPGWGPVTAGHAREIVAQQRRAEWRFAILDNDGRLVFDGVTRRRPAGISRTGPPGGIVELHIPATLLEHLVADASTSGIWAEMVADIARQYADRHDRELDVHPDDRLPRAALRRHTQIRDRTCVGPGCRHRAARCDQDHTVDYQNGGDTVAADLAPACRHDHRLKHDGGWLLKQPEPGVFVWTSPLGGVYEVRPEPLEPPLPSPEPGADDPWHDQPADEDGIPLILHKPPRPPPASTPPQQAVDDPDEPAPF